jgi:hypothetical protein
MGFNRGFGAVLLVALAALPAKASPYLDALTSTPNQLGNSNTYSAISTAESFEVGASGTISEVELAMFKTSSLTTGSVKISLYANNGSNEPGTLLDPLAALADMFLPSRNTRYIIDITGLDVTGLSAGTEYWIEVSETSGTSTSQEGYTDPNAASEGALSYTSYLAEAPTSGMFTTSAAQPPSLAICISGDNSCMADNGLNASNSNFLSDPIPEPPSSVLLAAALSGLAMVRRYRFGRGLTIVR